MEGINNLILRKAESKSNEFLRGFLVNLMSKQKQFQSPKGYYWVTDLCNPVKKYLEENYPKIEKIDVELEKIFARGNKIHRYAEIWMQNMDKFFHSESKLDGFFMGIRAVGKIDAKIDGKIIEIKSKINLPLTIEEVIKKYPQDIEQLAFYSVMDPLNPKENYLVFISQDIKQKMIAFKVIIEDKGGIVNVLKQRINLLDGVRKGYVDPIRLGKCRFCYKEKCPYNNKGLCKWENESLPCEILDFIKIVKDDNFKEKLFEAKLKWGEESEIFRINDIIGSRTCLYNNALEKIDEDWDEPIEKTLAKDYISNLVFNLTKEHGEKILNVPKRKIKEIRHHKSWINLKTSINPLGKISPYVTQASLTEKEWYLRFPPGYKIMELGIICAIYGKSSGYIFEYLPNLDIKFRVFEVFFNSPEEIVKEVNHIIKILKNNNIETFNELPLCPDFFCKDCSIKEYCEKRNKK